MDGIRRVVTWQYLFLLAVVVATTGLTGCASHRVVVPAEQMPRELNKTTQPDYRIEPPDVLLVEMVTAIPKPPYKVQPLDSLLLSALDAPPDSPINGVYPVELDGTLSLGPFYGSIPVAGLTIPEVKVAMQAHLIKFIKNPAIEVALAQGRGMQQVSGPHLVRGDGTINLGVYGSVSVVNMTLPEAQHAIEQKLSEYFQNPEVSLDISGYNSKVYYVIFDTGGSGQPIQRLPLTGNETVLDALSQTGGLIAVSNANQIWVARPSDDGMCQKLPVDWKAVTEQGDTRTNYQLLPGDRVFVKAYPLTTVATVMERVFYPIERVFGMILIGNGTVRSLSGQGGGGFGGFGF